MTDTPDRRLNAYRPDLADIRLQGMVDAKRFVSGQSRIVTDAVLDLHDDADPASAIGTQALLGERVNLFDEADGLAWIQLEDDRYVGYANAQGLAATPDNPTHVVSVPRTFIYTDADLRSPVRMACSMGSRIAPLEIASTRGTDYCRLREGGWVIAAHLAPLPSAVADYVAVAAQFLNTPYLWGGTSAFGLDCSGLVRLAMAMCGKIVPRDTDMQAASLGEEIDPGNSYEGLKRGDLLFWKGHVAIAEGNGMAIHASGHAMQVVREPVNEAINRIARLFGRPTAVRRLR